MSVDVPLLQEVSPLPVAGEPVPSLSAATCVERVDAALEAFSALSAVRHELSSAQVAAVTRSLLAALQLAESAATGMVAEAIQRGIVTESTAAGPMQWVLRLGAGEAVSSLLPETGPLRVSGPLIPLVDADVADPDPSVLPVVGAAESGVEVSVDRVDADDAVDADAADHEPTAPGVEESVDRVDAGDADADHEATVSVDGADCDGADCDGVGPDGVGRLRGQVVPGVEPVVASRMVKVAVAMTQRKHDVLTQAVTSNRVGLAAARTALVEVDKILPVLPVSSHDQVYSHFLALPPGSGARAIRELSKRVIATFADEDFLVDVDAKLDAAETVTWSELPNGMSRLVAELGPLHAAQVKHALGALSAPSPGNTCCDDVFHRHTGERTGDLDERTAAKRAADAFMFLITKAASLTDSDTTVPTSGQAKIIVTIDHDTLIGKLTDHADQAAQSDQTGASGRGGGFGVTESGTALDAHLVRRLACDAKVLPMVLGSESEPLDVGREQRLVKRGMRAAVIARDRHCTYPGCGRPPSWCEVHHITPWFHGGATSLANSALLCSRHHTIVHRDGNTATVQPTGITWDLSPGRIQSSGHVA